MWGGGGGVEVRYKSAAGGYRRAWFTGGVEVEHM